MEKEKREGVCVCVYMFNEVTEGVVLAWLIILYIQVGRVYKAV